MMPALRIRCSNYKSTRVDGFEGAFRSNMMMLGLDSLTALDCGCGLSRGAFDTFDSSGDMSFGRQDAGLVFFLFRLLNKLQTLGTVPAIDWNAYAALLEADT